jgi:hypothetical protein
LTCGRLNCYFNLKSPLPIPVEIKKKDDQDGRGGGLTNDKGLTKNTEKITDRQLEAFKLKQEHLQYAEIGKRMGISKVAAFKLVDKFIRNSGLTKCKKGGLTENGGGLTKISFRGLTNRKKTLSSSYSTGNEPNANLQSQSKHTIRLHNDSIAISIKQDIGSIEGKPVKLKYVSYKLVKEPLHTFKIFNNKTVIQFVKDVEASTEEDAERLANDRIASFLKDKYGLDKFEQLSRHYGLLGTDLAKRYRKEGKKLIILDKIDGKVRLRIDFSHDRPEIDAEHIEHGKTDSEKMHGFIDDIIDRKHDLPSETKVKMDYVVDILNAYAQQMDLHLGVERKTGATLDKIKDAIIELKDTLKKKKR